MNPQIRIVDSDYDQKEEVKEKKRRCAVIFNNPCLSSTIVVLLLLVLGLAVKCFVCTAGHDNQNLEATQVTTTTE